VGSVAPFLRWAGGKRQLIPELIKSLPHDISDRRYVEPFLGAGSLYFAVAPARALIADANPFLIGAYRALRDKPDVVLQNLREHIRLHNEEHYYAVRAEYNKLKHSAVQAARFIYLNKACFNGIFRVNSKNEFNVPKGSKTLLQTPDSGEYKAISELLKKSSLSCTDYTKTMTKIREGDFVYIDPPYPALNATAYFNHYTSTRFDTDRQNKLAECVGRIHGRGAHFLLSNADIPSIRSLYSQFNTRRIPVTRFVSSNGKRTPVYELLITNY
jgi:DNA adenine methylase